MSGNLFGLPSDGPASSDREKVVHLSPLLGLQTALVTFLVLPGNENGFENRTLFPMFFDRLLRNKQLRDYLSWRYLILYTTRKALRRSIYHLSLYFTSLQIWHTRNGILLVFLIVSFFLFAST